MTFKKCLAEASISRNMETPCERLNLAKTNTDFGYCIVWLNCNCIEMNRRRNRTMMIMALERKARKEGNVSWCSRSRCLLILKSSFDCSLLTNLSEAASSSTPFCDADTKNTFDLVWINASLWFCHEKPQTTLGCVYHDGICFGEGNSSYPDDWESNFIVGFCVCRMFSDKIKLEIVMKFVSGIGLVRKLRQNLEKVWWVAES